MPAPSVRAWRVVLIVLGVLLLALGLFVLVDTMKPVKIAGIGLWFVLALIVHDGIIALVTFAVVFLLRRVGRRSSARRHPTAGQLPIAVLAIVQGALVVCSVFAIIVLPAVYKKSIGSKNPTVLPLDYGPSLVILWGVIGVLTGLAVVGYTVLARRQKNRPSVSQD